MGIYKISNNSRIARHTYRMVLEGDCSGFYRPGQFVEIAVPGLFLRRPISVADYTETSMILLYDVVGNGTKEMSAMQPGYSLDILAPLGNGFGTDFSGERPLLLGGGIGCAPMLGLARTLKAEGKNPIVALGFNTAEDVILQQELAEDDIECIIATADGTQGTKGFVTALLPPLFENSENAPTYFYACGPTPMMKALTGALSVDGQLSLEARMGCGFGACMGCSIQTRNGNRRICKDGPVFRKEDIIWT